MRQNYLNKNHLKEEEDIWKEDIVQVVTSDSF